MSRLAMIQVVDRRSLIAKSQFQNRVVHLGFVLDEVALGHSTPKDIGRCYAMLFRYCCFIAFLNLNVRLTL
jgi:hypothetical protein